MRLPLAAALFIASTTIGVRPAVGASKELHAPELSGSGWLNTPTPLSLRALRGKVVLLDFWTYARVDCLEALPGLKKLETRFPAEIAVVGVHSGKYDEERELENVRLAVIRHEISYPVLNDPDKKVWDAYSVRAWPTLVVIDAQGRVAARFEGKDRFEELSTLVARLVSEARAAGALNERPLPLKLERDEAPSGLLSFPGKVLSDPAGRRLFIADTGHNRVLIADFKGKVLEVIGSGASGYADGSYAQSQWRHPQGMALDGHKLYVADTENHRVRRVDLEKREVTTSIDDPNVRSPWDLLFHDGMLYVAAAGSHRLEAADSRTSRHFVFAGSSVEGLKDGLPPLARLAQPSGLAHLGGSIYIADSAASAIRAISVSTPAVVTLVGEGLSHPLGLAAAGGLLFIADTFNGKIKSLDPHTLEVRTVAAGFKEPGGLTPFDGGLLVADTGRHELVKLALDGRRLGVLTLTALKAPRRGPPMSELPDQRIEKEVGPFRIKAGADTKLLLSVDLPRGYHLNPRAPFRYRIAETLGVMTFAADTRRGILMDPRFPLALKFTAPAGRGQAVLDVDFFYCRKDNKGLCLAASQRYRVLIDSAPDGKGRAISVVAKP